MSEVIVRLSALLKKREISSVELTKKYISAIEESNPVLNAYVSFNFETALKQAEIADKMLEEGNASPLCGIPMSLKDNISMKGVLTTCASKILQGYKPFYDSTVWSRLEKAGAVMLGKTNMDEFAMGSTCETSCYGATKNPRDITRVPGGSSGGGASAVCGKIAAYALGSDTGGSIRQPASFCGIVGFKPGYGSVSRYGLVAFGSSLDQIGPLTYGVKDAALVFDAIKGKDENDPTSCDIPMEDIAPRLEKDVKGLKIGLVDEYLDGLNDEVKRHILRSAEFFEENGAEIVKMSLPEIKLALPVYYILSCAEASSNLGRFDGIRYGYRVENYTSVDDMIEKVRSEGFGKEVKRRIMLGSYVLSSGYYDAYYKKARLLRRKISSEFEEAFKKCDAILAPTAVRSAYPLDHKKDSVIDLYLSDVFTVPVNIAALPSVSVPCGNASDGMPVGMQFIGGKLCEEKILSAAYYYEQNYDCGVKEYEGGVKL